MKIIDRYLLRQFVQTFLICYLSLNGLYIVFDAFTNLEDFLRSAEKCGGLAKLMGSFYAYQSMAFFDHTSGLLGLVAAMFTVSWLQRHNEMTALMAAGISRIRIVAPILVAAVVLGLLATVNRELVIPKFAEQLAQRPQDLVGDVGQGLQPQYDNQTNILIRGRATYRDQLRIEKPDFLLPRELSAASAQQELVAENAYYQPPAGDRPGGYLLEGVQQPRDLGTRHSLRLGAEPIVITPRDAPEWLKPDQCFVRSDLSFEQLTGGRAFRQFASTAQLIAGLRNPSLEFGADVRVAIHSRMVQPLLDLTLLLLGLPLVAARESRNVFVAIGLCLALVTVFLLVVLGLQHLGSLYLIDPALAAWAPLMLFVPPAVGLAESMWR